MGLSVARGGKVNGDLLADHVIPTKAGIYITLKIWIPAFAGMTDVWRGVADVKMNDEPASELLARIKAERLVSQGDRKGGRS